MEDSLVTGLRARDLQGRITYVNPAFCAMVGFSPQELLGQSTCPTPYWPPELADEYRQRQAKRLAGGMRPRARASNRSSCARTARGFPVLIIEAPLINAYWAAHRLDECLPGHQRTAPHRGALARLAGAPAGHARLATVGEMASLLSHELNQPLAAIASYATGSLNLLDSDAPGVPTAHAATCRTCAWRCERIAGRPSAQARDQQRARLCAPPRPDARGRAAPGPARCHPPAGEPAGPQAGVRWTTVEAHLPPVCATAPWSSRCC
jgi:two-component system sensor histidine kinase DctS